MDPISMAIAAVQPKTGRACEALITADAMPQAEFKIFTGMLKAWATDDGKKRLKGVASSTTRDLHGDVMLESALEDMERSASNGMTIFLNHSYNVPEDVAGTVENAKMVSRGVDGDGNPNYDLDFQIVINEMNPRAVVAWQAIQAGTLLGLSIGAMIPEGGAVRDKKSGALTIAHVNLLETSIVSIPANPRSWIDRSTGASKALLKAWRVEKSRTVPLGSPTLTLDGSQYTIQGSLDSVLLSQESPGTGVIMEGIEVPADGVMREFVIETTIEITDAATCSDCGKDKGAGGCDNPFHKKDVEPDISDSRVRIIEIDTDDDKPSGGDSSSQEGDTDPETEEEWSAEPTTAPDSTVVTASLNQLEPIEGLRETLRTLNATATLLIETRLQLAQEQEARKAAERARDETNAQAQLLLSQVRDLVSKLAETPIGRKSTFRQAESELSHLEGIYSRDFLKLAQNGR